MLTSIKLTKRIDIDKNDVQIVGSKVPLENGLCFPKIERLSLSLEHDFPPESEILLRFKVNHHARTLNFGTIGNIIIPGVDALGDMITYEMDLKFVLCVADPQTGKLLGSTKGWKYVFYDESGDDSEQGQSSLSPISIDFRDTGERIWELDQMNRSERFVKIFFNIKVQSKDSLKKDPLIANMYIPEVLNKLIMYIIDNSLSTETRSKETWVGKVNLMLDYFNLLDKVPSSSDSYLDKDDFINEFISKFLVRNRNHISKNSIRRLEEVLSNE